MDRNQITTYIKKKYGVSPERLWSRYPDYQVFRQTSNRKWFAIVMDVPRCKMGLAGDEIIHVMNVKCEKDMVGTLVGSDGYFPAYHMNKSNWLSIIVENDMEAQLPREFMVLSEKTIKSLIDMSYGLTEQKNKK